MSSLFVLDDVRVLIDRLDDPEALEILFDLEEALESGDDDAAVRAVDAYSGLLEFRHFHPLPA